MRALVLAFALNFCADPLWANARITILLDALQIDEIVAIVVDEGISYGEELNQDMLQGEGGAFWNGQVRQIYQRDRIKETLRDAFEDGLSPDEVEAAIAFFTSDEGSTIISLENKARRAMSDEEIEQTARNFYASVKGSEDPLLRYVRSFIEVNDLIERNVSGAMSANYQFFKGLSDGRFLEQSEEEILSDIYAQQDDIRADTESWLYGYLLVAYQPLPLEALQKYIAYSASPAGQALNAALFEGYEVVFRDVSYALGRAVALNAKADEI